MTLSSYDRTALEQTESLTPYERQLIAIAIGDMFFWANNRGHPLAKDDRLAALEAAFIRYMLESRLAVPATENALMPPWHALWIQGRLKQMTEPAISSNRPC